MGIPVMLIGKSGSGKSTSLRNFAEDELYLIKVLNKPLPFRKRFESTFSTDKYNSVMAALQKGKKKSFVIDDAGYLITNQFMNGHSGSKGGSSVFALYNDIADRFWELVDFVSNVLPEDKIVYFIMHEDKNDMGDIKPKTIGKLLDEKVCIEGMFTIVLRCVTEEGQHVFKTKTDGLDVTKSPMDMFAEETMDNDLKLVDDQIREYYGLSHYEAEEEDSND